MDLFFNFDGDPIPSILRSKEKFIIRATYLSDRCYHAEYLSSVATIIILEKSFLMRSLGDELRVFKNPTQEEFDALNKVYEQMVVSKIMGS